MNLLTPAEAAARLQVSRRTLARLVARGLPVVRLSARCYRIPETGLQSWIEENTEWASAERVPAAGVSRSSATAGALARRLGAPRKRGKSKPHSAAIITLPASGGRPSEA
jgi:excisionase family DNA binding protein